MRHCGGSPDRVVQGRLDAAQVGNVALGDRHDRIAPSGWGEDPGIPEDGDLRMRRPGSDGAERIDECRIGRVADRVLEGRSILILAWAALTETQQAEPAAVDDGVDEDPAEAFGNLPHAEKNSPSKRRRVSIAFPPCSLCHASIPALHSDRHSSCDLQESDPE